MVRRIPRVQATVQERALVLGVYRTLLRVCSRFDAQPLAKILMHRTDKLDASSSAALATTGTGNSTQLIEGPRSHYSAVLDRLFKSNILFPPKKIVTLSLRQFVKDEFRRDDGVIPVSARISTAFQAIRKMSELWSVYIGMIPADSKPKSAKGAVPSRASMPAAGVRGGGGGALLPEPEEKILALDNVVFPGVVLIAHPMVHGPLSRAVVLILQHSRDGSYGVIINHKSNLTLGQVVKNLPYPMEALFSKNETFFGGPVKRLQVIHPYGTLEGVRAVQMKDSTGGGAAVKEQSALSFFSGGMTENNLSILLDQENNLKAASESDAGSSLASAPAFPLKEFRFFTGCCTWDSGELAAQVREGYWIPSVMTPSHLDTILRAESRASGDGPSLPSISISDQRAQSSSESGGKAPKYVSFSSHSKKSPLPKHKDDVSVSSGSASDSVATGGHDECVPSAMNSSSNYNDSSNSNDVLDPTSDMTVELQRPLGSIASAMLHEPRPAASNAGTGPGVPSAFEGAAVVPAEEDADNESGSRDGASGVRRRNRYWNWVLRHMASSRSIVSKGATSSGPNPEAPRADAFVDPYAVLASVPPSINIEVVRSLD